MPFAQVKKTERTNPLRCLKLRVHVIWYQCKHIYFPQINPSPLPELLRTTSRPYRNNDDSLGSIGRNRFLQMKNGFPQDNSKSYCARMGCWDMVRGHSSNRGPFSRNDCAPLCMHFPQERTPVDVTTCTHAVCGSGNPWTSSRQNYRALGGVSGIDRPAFNRQDDV